jgi:ribosomal-protein-alanine N-acetyltransferase
VNDPLWLRFIGERNVRSLEDARGYIDRIRDGSYAIHGFGLWAAERLGAGEVTGICGLLKRAHLEVPDIGFALLERHRGQGLASEALAATLVLAHDRFGLRQVAAVTDLDNVASQRVLEGAGFRFEQVVRWAESDDNVRLYRRALP